MQIRDVSPDANEPECPDYFHVGAWYHLIFSHYARARYLVSDKPFTDWRVPSDPYIPCSSVPKAAVWKDRIIFTGFEGHNGYGGHMTFMEAAAGENCELHYFPVEEAK